MIWDDTWGYEMLWDDMRLYKMIWDDTRWYEMIGDDTRRDELRSDTIEGYLNKLHHGNAPCLATRGQGFQSQVQGWSIEANSRLLSRAKSLAHTQQYSWPIPTLVPWKTFQVFVDFFVLKLVGHFNIKAPEFVSILASKLLVCKTIMKNLPCFSEPKDSMLTSLSLSFILSV